jgi:hypothetical protein
MVTGPRLSRTAKAITAGFFGLLLAVGILVHDDYGVSWDEPFQKEYGRDVHAYVTHGDTRMLEGPNRYYGPAFEILLLSVERGLNLRDSRDIYLMRHLAGFLLFFAATVFFYKLCLRIFGDWRIALLGAVLFVTSPRIFAHAFFNPKDLPFMSLFTISAFTLVDLLDQRTITRALVHALVCAVLIDIRIVGVMLPALTLAFMFAGPAAVAGGAKRLSRRLLVPAAYLGVLGGLVIAFWPTLWEDPPRRFIEAFVEMSRYPLDLPVKYMGRFLEPSELPWHYSVVWMGISIPPVHLVCFACGLVGAFGLLFKGWLAPSVRRRDVLLLLVWFFLPVLYLPLSGAAVFDEWRHVFFVYPAIVGISLVGVVYVLGAVRGLRGTMGRRVVAFGVLAALGVGIGTSVHTMARYHPFEHVYFNALAGGIDGAEGRFDLDYWGLSYRAALEFILDSDDSPAVEVSVYSRPGLSNADILHPGQRKRLEFVDNPYDATYFLTHERWNRLRYPPQDEFYAVRLDGVRIMLVLKETAADSVVTVLGK